MADYKVTGRPLVFLGVGIINTVLDFSFYTLLTSTVFKNGENIALAGIISGTFALICAFFTHGFITWRGSNLTRFTLMKFFIFTGFGMWVLRPLLLSVFINFNSFFEWLYLKINNLGLTFSYNFIANTAAFSLMLIILLLYNYLVYDRFVFTSKTNHIEPENH